MFDTLNEAFPKHSFFFEVVGISMHEALDRCARVAGSAGEVVTSSEKIILASDFDLGNEIDWLIPILPSK